MNSDVEFIEFGEVDKQTLELFRRLDAAYDSLRDDIFNKCCLPSGLLDGSGALAQERVAQGGQPSDVPGGHPARPITYKGIEIEWIPSFDSEVEPDGRED